MKPGSCLDAETLAAWADDRLTADQRDAVEAHAADCARCQAVIAALVRAEPPAAPAPAWWRRGATLGWLVPITAAAAAVAIWVAVPGTPRSAPPADAATSPVAVVQPGVSPAGAPSEPSLKAAAAAKQGAAPSTSAEIVSGDVVSEPAKKAERFEASKAPAAPALQDTKGAAAPTAQAPVGASAASNAVEPPAPAAAAPLVKSQARAAVGPVVGGVAGGVAAESLRAAAAPVEIVSSNPASRWRLTRASGIVERSMDGGATWVAQQTGVQADLTAGASPLPSICWLVGRSGMVLLTTDGSTWRRVPFPEAADLTAVQSAGASIATVTAAGGRKFSTTDAGATWDREPLQEIPASPF